MAKQYRDDVGREVVFSHPPKRIVSLVPSDTHSLFALGAGGRVVGRTSYCEEPKIAVPDIPDVGGTKNVDPDKVAELAPDLVLVNKEENTERIVRQLAERGLRMWVSFPVRVADGISHLARLARILGLEKDERVVELLRKGYELGKPVERAMRRGVVAIWDDPLMTVNQETFGSDVMALCGLQNVFAGRKRQYPLSADLGKRPGKSDEELGDRDRRYPRISDQELVEAAPEVVLLPDEPFTFAEEHAERFRGLDIPAARNGQVHLVSGKDLFWYGAWSVDGVPRLRKQLE